MKKMSDMDALGLILDIGREMILCGAETHRVEDSLYRICRSFRFTDANIWVIPSNIQATVQTEDGNCITQVRHIRYIVSIDFRRLEMLNELSRSICSGAVSPEEVRDVLGRISSCRSASPAVSCAAAALASMGFGAFFNCSPEDIAAAGLAALVIAGVRHFAAKKISNPLALNFIAALFSELFILFCVSRGFGEHPDRITAGVVMLLISALSAANGLMDLFRLDTLSGILNIASAFTGAVGIALGIVLGLILSHTENLVFSSAVAPGILLPLVSSAAGCTGFALLFHVTGRKIAVCAAGSALVWGIYYICISLGAPGLPSVITASAFCGAFSFAMAICCEAPATIFRTVCIFPLIPGASLFHFMQAMVVSNTRGILENGKSLAEYCFGIVIGFMIIDMVLAFRRESGKRAAGQ